MDANMAEVAKKVKVLLILAIAMTLSLGVNLFQGTTITLDVDGNVIQKVSYESTVEDLLTEEGIILTKDTRVEPSLEALILKDIKVTVTNPKNYTIITNDGELEIESYNNNVKDILKDANINLGWKDFAKPGLEEKISPNTRIQVYQVEEKLRVEQVAIPYETETITNIRLDKGIQNTLQEGQDGFKRSHIKDIFINGEFASSVIVLDTIVSEPQSRVLEQGANDIISTSRGDTRFQEALVMEASAYDLSYASTGKSPGDKYYGVTASGTTARPGTVAVDPRVIPLGTKLYVESLDGTSDYGFAIAEDRGSAIKGNRIDLFFSSNKAAMNFGRRNVKVYILE
ncbi:MAG: 3D domain-containing protein [Gudongella sp.]|nr:3D domain-containing protein [Gudongella sp.]